LGVTLRHGVLDKQGWQAELREIHPMGACQPRLRFKPATRNRPGNAQQTTLAATCLDPRDPRDPHPLDHADSPS
jgi:hypothetical protein